MKAYPKYKDSGVPWLGDVPEHWEAIPLCAISKLKSITSSEHLELLSVYLNKGVIRFSNVEQKRTNVTSEDKSKYQRVDPGDFVLNNQQAWRGSVGVSRHTGIVSPAYLVLNVSEQLKTDYANYLFRDKSMVVHYLVSSKGVGSIQRNLYWPQLKRITIFIPTQDEQQKISRYLDWQISKINKFIKAKKKLITLLKEQKQNVINEAVTKGINPDVKMKDSGVESLGEIPAHWEVRKLKHIAAMKSGDNLTSMEVEEQGQYPVYGGNGLRGYYHAYNRSGSFLLVGRQGALCGNVHRVRGDFWATEHAVVITLKKGICLDWYYYMLVFMNLNQYSEAAAQPGISVEKIQNLRTTVPPIGEQEQIAKFIDTETALIDKTIARTEREIELIQEYRTRLVSDVVTGKVDVRSEEIPDFEPALADLEAQDDEESEDERVAEGIEE